MDPELESVVVRMCDAMADGDAKGLEQILADDMRLIHMTGMVQSRGEFISAVTDGTLRYHKISIVSIEGTSDGTMADIILRSKTDATVFGGSRHVWKLESHLKVMQDGVQWKICESRVTTF